MSPREFTITCDGLQHVLYLKVSLYQSPPFPAARLIVSLETKDGHEVFAVMSASFPDFPVPGPRQFYVKTWGENEGLLAALLAVGAVRLVFEGGIEINQFGSKTFVAELAWPDSAMMISLPKGYEPLLQRQSSASVTLDEILKHHPAAQHATTRSNASAGPTPGVNADEAFPS